MSIGDSLMHRKAAQLALEEWGLCECPVQVFRLARCVAPQVEPKEECTCPICVGVLATAYSHYMFCRPEVIADFHRQGAGAKEGPGEQRDEKLIGPYC